MNEQTVDELRTHLKAIEKIISEKCPEAEYLLTVQVENDSDDEAMDVFYGVKSDNVNSLIDLFSNVFELIAAENPDPEVFNDFLNGFGITGPSGEA
tara:strand:+ start:638 stop:925 length:288 start_codon:yes stop_codon:yes gene_type:complete